MIGPTITLSWVCLCVPHEKHKVFPSSPLVQEYNLRRHVFVSDVIPSSISITGTCVCVHVCVRVCVCVYV